MICDQGTSGLDFWEVGDIQQKAKGQAFSLAGRLPPSPQFFFLVGHPDLSIRKTLRMVLNLILKTVGGSIFFQINKFTASLKIKKRRQILLYGIQSSEDYPSISR